MELSEADKISITARIAANMGDHNYLLSFARAGVGTAWGDACALFALGEINRIKAERIAV